MALEEKLANEAVQKGLTYAHKFISSISDQTQPSISLDFEESSLIAYEAIKEFKKFVSLLEESTMKKPNRVKQGPLAKVRGINPKEMVDPPAPRLNQLVSSQVPATKELSFVKGGSNVINMSFSNPVLSLEGSTTSSKHMVMQSSFSGVLTFSGDTSTKCASSSRTCHCSRKR